MAQLGAPAFRPADGRAEADREDAAAPVDAPASAPEQVDLVRLRHRRVRRCHRRAVPALAAVARHPRDRKSTRLNSSHQIISYAVFCLKKKKKTVNFLPPDTSHPGLIALTHLLAAKNAARPDVLAGTVREVLQHGITTALDHQHAAPIK